MYGNAIAVKIAEKYREKPLTDFTSVNQRTLLENLNWMVKSRGFCLAHTLQVVKN